MPWPRRRARPRSHSLQRNGRRGSSPPLDPLAARRAIAEGYLRAANINPSVATCPAATLAADVAREPATHPIRAAYIAGVRAQVDVLTRLGDTGDADRDRAAAGVQLATMMGALLLARATRGDAVSSEILEAARRHLTTDLPLRAPLLPVPSGSRRTRRGLPRRDGTS